MGSKLTEIDILAVNAWFGPPGVKIGARDQILIFSGSLGGLLSKSRFSDFGVGGTLHLPLSREIG